jgi:vacuolar-type H+-ATPase subunit E/Vma4
MALEQIREAVLESARKEAEGILEAARGIARDAVDAGEQQAKVEAERRYRAETRAIEEEYARRLIHYRGTANKELLALRNARLREVFDAAREAVLAWPQEEYAAFLRERIERAAEGCGALRVHADDREVIAAILNELNLSRGEENRLVLDEETLPERGGFVFVGPNFEVDQTLATLLAEIEHELSPVIASELFREQKLL